MKHFMKNALHIIILLLFVFVIPTNSALACGNTSDKDKMEQMDYSKDDSTSTKMSCCSTDSDTYNGCGGFCDNASCHCPSTTNSPVYLNVFFASHSIHHKVMMNDWAYVPPAPRAVYLAIWQLPKIS